jgi:U4/U6.U5 tri-snRNP-associated protein 2
MDLDVEACENLDGKVYIPGCVGLNNLKSTDYINVVIQMIVRVRQIREFCLLGNPKGPLSEKLAILIKKMWNNRNFKGVVSPHEFIQTLSEVSQKKFKIGKADDPLTLLLWLINNLDIELKKGHIKNTHILSLFRGRL